MLDLSSPELRFALDAVSEAVRLAQGVRRTLVAGALEKRDRSPVTVADFSVQALIARRLLESFPEDVLVAEEDSEELGRPESREVLRQVVDWVNRFAQPAGAKTVLEWLDHGTGRAEGRFWTLDPIDGTKGFLRGGHYAVALALIEDGVVRLGVVGCPHWSADSTWLAEGSGSVVAAVPGSGTWWRSLSADGRFTRLKVSGREVISQARILRSFESAHTNDDKMRRLAQILGTSVEPLRLDSQVKYAVLASGSGDLLLRLLRSERPDYREKIWDQAAGSLIVSEAGGRISDLDGRELDFSAGRTLARNRGILASNGLLHEACLEALAGLDRKPLRPEAS